MKILVFIGFLTKLHYLSARYYFTQNDKTIKKLIKYYIMIIVCLSLQITQ